MPRNAQSIPAIVASIITRDLALYECFRRKVVNYHAVAASIKPEVERMAGKQTTINTIVVAITRFSDPRVDPRGNKSTETLRGARIALASDVINVTVRAGKSELYEIAKRIGALSANLSGSTRMFQLSNSIELIADEDEYDSLIKSSLKSFEIRRERTELSRLDIHLSPSVEPPPEFGLLLAELLYRRGINIQQSYIGKETVLILSRADGPRAYEILQDEIDASRVASSGDGTRPKVSAK
ncbi:MAG: hypothetical protein JRN09_08505 [Nitrososphaerota archaeon]|jgi:hypothetical protein|nr:hypothetical protein [Nitrososphaerota archaeon]